MNATHLSPARPQKPVVWILLLLSAAYFAAFIPPNAAASENLEMVGIFQPDEAVPLPYALAMIQPAATVKDALINFAFYKYYFYGYPHFAVSALALLPIRLLGRLEDTPLVMATLRQMVSVLPMLAAILLLVYLQTRFRSYRAVALFVLLASLPAVVENNFWWHPDSLAILFAVLAIFFLNRDDLRLGWNFYAAAAFCGFSAGTKGIGFYLFLAVLACLALARIVKKASLARLALAGLGFLATMAAAYLLANPILVYESVRRDYFFVMREQSRLLAGGYEVIYSKGPAAAWPVLKEFYGHWIFLALAAGLCVYRSLRGPDRLLSTLILAWALPITAMVFFWIHFKYQYWLPVALPLISCVTTILPGKEAFDSLRKPSPPRAKVAPFAQLGLAVLVLAQWGAFIRQDTARYTAELRRAENNASLQFYQDALAQLEPLPAGPYWVYKDVRVYFPQLKGWTTEARFELLDYEYIQSRSFAVLLLMQQRINDYLNPSVEGIDPEQLARSRIFYRDADRGTLTGYRLLYRDAFGLIYVEESVFLRYFAP